MNDIEKAIIGMRGLKELLPPHVRAAFGGGGLNNGQM